MKRLAIGLAAAALIVPTAAEAGKLLTGADIKNNSLTSLDIKNRSLKAVDFAPGQLPRGAQGKQGSPGVAGPQGAPGAPGAPGISGYQIVKATGLIGLDTSHVIATCPAGKVVIGGGASTPYAGSYTGALTYNAPSPLGNNGWAGSAASGTIVTAHAICATVSS